MNKKSISLIYLFFAGTVLDRQIYFCLFTIIQRSIQANCSLALFFILLINKSTIHQVLWIPLWGHSVKERKNEIAVTGRGTESSVFLMASNVKFFLYTTLLENVNVSVLTIVLYSEAITLHFHPPIFTLSNRKWHYWAKKKTLNRQLQLTMFFLKVLTFVGIVKRTGVAMSHKNKDINDHNIKITISFWIKFNTTTFLITHITNCLTPDTFLSPSYSLNVSDIGQMLTSKQTYSTQTWHSVIFKNSLLGAWRNSFHLWVLH